VIQAAVHEGHGARVIRLGSRAATAR
jgi:hypothetical protein